MATIADHCILADCPEVSLVDVPHRARDATTAVTPVVLAVPQPVEDYFDRQVASGGDNPLPIDRWLRLRSGPAA